MEENAHAYTNDFYENIKAKKSNIYRNFNSKKKLKMYFENLKGNERKHYMEEQNLKDININTINFTGIKKLPLETQKFIFDEWVSRYGDRDTKISNNTKLARYQLQFIRKQIGYPPSNGKKGIKKPKHKSVTKETVKQTYERVAKAVNGLAISISDLGCTAEEIKAKIEAVGMLLNKNKNYKLVLQVNEI